MTEIYYLYIIYYCFIKPCIGEAAQLAAFVMNGTAMQLMMGIDDDDDDDTARFAFFYKNSLSLYLKIHNIDLFLIIF
jgi:hypothetical protein